MQYQEFSPSPLLRPFVKCYWQLIGKPEVLVPERVVPDGRMELIFHFGDRFERIDDKVLLQPRSIVTGQITGPLVLKATGEIGIFAVRFRPQGFTAIFSESASSLRDQIVSFCDLSRESSQIEEQIALLPNFASRVALVENFLATKASQSRILDRSSRAAAQIFYQNPKEESILQTAIELGLSLRQFERVFKSQVGLSPSKFIRISRFQRALRLKLINPTLSLTHLGLECGYYDQSHFSREFKDLSGLSPRQYFSQEHVVTDLFTAL